MSAAVAAVKLQPTTAQIIDDGGQRLVPSDSLLDVTDSMSILDQDQIDQYVILCGVLFCCFIISLKLASASCICSYRRTTLQLVLPLLENVSKDICSVEQKVECTVHALRRSSSQLALIIAVKDGCFEHLNIMFSMFVLLNGF